MVEEWNGKEPIGICKLNPDGSLRELERGWYEQGYIFKDWDAFQNRPDDPCYVPELSDSVYTRNSIVELCDGQEVIAEIIFDNIDWQHPESYFDELFTEGELSVCNHCKRIFRTYETGKCPYCGKETEEENGI